MYKPLCSLLAEEEHLQIYLIASTKDMLGYQVYPQPAYTLQDMKGLKKPNKNIHCCSNPCVLSLNGVRVCVNNTDLLFGLVKQCTRSRIRDGRQIQQKLTESVFQTQMYALWAGLIFLDCIHSSLHLKNHWTLINISPCKFKNIPIFTSLHPSWGNSAMYLTCFEESDF